LLGAVELQPIEGKPTARAMSVFRQCFDNGLLGITTGDTVALSPPLIASEDEIRTVVAKLKESLNSID
jgi:beta-alanine--pyruvate transaminase